MKIHQIALLIPIALLTTIPQTPIHQSAIVGITQAVAQTPSEHKAEADKLLEQGNQQFKIGQLKAALRLWQQALIIYRETKDRQGEGNTVRNIGTVYYILKDYPKAIEYYQQWLAIAHEIQDHRNEVYALSTIGHVYSTLEDYPKAIEYYQQWLGFARKIQDRRSEGYALATIGHVYSTLGDSKKAIEYYQQWLAIAREIRDRQSERDALAKIGHVYSTLGDSKKAIEYYHQDLAISREIHDRQSEGNALAKIGHVYSTLGDYAKAIEYYQQLLGFARQTQDRQSESSALVNLGSIYSTVGDYKKAIEYYHQGLAILKKLNNSSGKFAALGGLGYIFYKQGNLAEAEKTLYELIKVLESLRENRDLNEQSKVWRLDFASSYYNTLQEILIAQNKTNAALEIAERGRARVFVELLASRLSTNNQQVDKSPKPPTIVEIKQIAKQQNATLVQYSIISDKYFVQSKPKEIDLYIWVIKPTGEVTFRKADLKALWQKEKTTLAQLVTNSRESIGVRSRGITVIHNPNPAKEKQHFQKLHELLINPIADLLPKNPDDKVVFIPQLSLFLVPFAALQDEQGKYLIEKHTILTAPSIQVLDLTHQQRQGLRGNQALVMGNPIMPSVPPKIGEAPQQLPALPGAEKEAKEIAQILNTKAITGKDATKAAFIQRLPQARFIHLATHGLLDDFKGLGVPGAVALAPDGKDNGLLTANEILDLKINAELVVLSACDTAQGTVTGDGVIGLSRALIFAGAPSVIVTLWSIPDSPSALLMGEFYRQLQKNPDKAQALRQAMLVTMKQHPHPSAWAAFTLIGEAK